MGRKRIVRNRGTNYSAKAGGTVVPKPKHLFGNLYTPSDEHCFCLVFFGR